MTEVLQPLAAEPKPRTVHAVSTHSHEPSFAELVYCALRVVARLSRRREGRRGVDVPPGPDAFRAHARPAHPFVLVLARRERRRAHGTEAALSLAAGDVDLPPRERLGDEGASRDHAPAPPLRRPRRPRTHRPDRRPPADLPPARRAVRGSPARARRRQLEPRLRRRPRQRARQRRSPRSTTRRRTTGRPRTARRRSSTSRGWSRSRRSRRCSRSCSFRSSGRAASPRSSPARSARSSA